MKNKSVGIIASDLRQIYMAEYFKQEKYQVVLWDLMRDSDTACPVNLFACDVLILPVPVSCIGNSVDIVEGIQSRREKNLHTVTDVYGGVFPPELKDKLQKLQVKIHDVLLESDVATRNAIATAEGAIAELSSLMPVNIQGAKIAVMGFGNCGREIAKRLFLWKADVTIVARSATARTEACQMGYEAYHFTDAIPYQILDAIVNTVPAQVVDENVIKKLKKDSVILDIASAPGGCDHAYCKKWGIASRLALGLPGKYSPKTSAKILLDAMPFC